MAQKTKQERPVTTTLITINHIFTFTTHDCVQVAAARPSSDRCSHGTLHHHFIHCHTLTAHSLKQRKI
eukprot:6490401-Amphidinium_carterae.3